MKIAIIGAGISGLTFYLWLKKLGLVDNHEVHIYERRTSARDTGFEDEAAFSSSLIGGSLGLGTNGIRVLRKLDEALYAEVMSTGNHINSWRLSSARGFTLVNVGVSGEGEESVMIGRDDFVSCLRKRVPEGVIVNKKLTDIDMGDAIKTLTFDDGSQITADLVVGGDGIWSTVRRCMFSVAADAKTYEYAPRYEGLVGVGSFVPAKLMESVPQGQMNVVFGRNGFFGYGIDRNTAKDGRGIRWSTYTLDKLPTDWRNIDTEDAQRQLQARHKSWKNAVIQRLIAEIEIDRVWPTCTTPPLPTWESSGCVLLGDAAHALQPSSGQGTSMALEDTEVLARLLAHHLAQDPRTGHRLACKQYSDIRMPRLARIHKKAQQIGSMKQDMGVVQEFVMYFFVWAMGFFGIGKAYNEFVNTYDAEAVVREFVRTSEVIRGDDD